MANKEQGEGKGIDQALYAQAKDFYFDSSSRLIFIGAENSAGFHDPAEAARVPSDSTAFAGKAEGLLRQALSKAGVDVPAEIDLELDKYLNDRGATRVQFKPDQEIADPYGLQQRFNSKKL